MSQHPIKPIRPNISALPSARFGYKAWLRFAPYLKVIIKDHYPQPVLLDVSPLSAQTFSARCRDAMRGRVAHTNWTEPPTPSDLVKTFRFLGGAGTWVIRPHDEVGEVYFGPPLRELNAHEAATKLSLDTAVSRLDDLEDPTAVNALCYLKNKDFIESVVTLVNLTPERKAALEATYPNIHIDEDNQLI